MFQTLRMLPSHILGLEGELVGIVGIGVVATVWALAPFLDDPKGRGPRARLWSTVGVVAIVYVAIFTVLAYVLGAPK
jgi:quinol-cytochrome oxidoreductase complex cytochrome b subunit